MFFFVITIKIPFLSSLLISLYYKSIKRVSYIKTNISAGGDYFIDIPIEVRWFFVTGFLAAKYF